MEFLNKALKKIRHLENIFVKLSRQNFIILIFL